VLMNPRYSLTDDFLNPPVPTLSISL